MTPKKIFRTVVLCAMFLVPACKCVDSCEIAKWKWGDFPVTNVCPLNKFPSPINPTLGIAAETKAINSWNKSLSVAPFVIDKKNGYPILKATSKHPKFAEYCELMKLGDGRKGQNFGHVFAWTDIKGRPGQWDIKTYVCLEKFYAAIKLMNTPAAQRAKIIGLYGFIKHELGHHLMGPNHSRTYAELMSKQQQNNSIHYHTKALIEETVIKQCKTK